MVWHQPWFDWRRYIPPDLQRICDTFSYEQKWFIAQTVNQLFSLRCEPLGDGSLSSTRIHPRCGMWTCVKCRCRRMACPLCNVCSSTSMTR